MRICSAAAVAVSLLVLTACGGTSGSTDSSEPRGDNANTSAAPAKEETKKPEKADPKFGETYTYEDGLSLAVSAPQDFKPSEYASADKAPAYVAFEITVVNKTGKKYDPSLIYATLQSGNQEAGQVFDSEKLGDTPSTTVLDGREVKFKMAFAVQDPKDLVFQISPDAGMEYDAVVFTS